MVIDWFIASAGNNKACLSVWDTGTSTAAPRQTINLGAPTSIYALEFSPTATHLAAATIGSPGLIVILEISKDGIITDTPLFRVFHPNTTLDPKNDGVGAVTFLTENRFVSGGIDGTLNLWDIGRQQPVSTVKGHSSGIFALRSLDEERFVSWGEDGSLSFWLLGKLQPYHRLTLPLPPKPLSLASLIWDAGTFRLFAHSASGNLLIIDVQRNFAVESVMVHQGGFHSVAKCGSLILTASAADGTIRALDRKTLRETARINSPAPFFQLQPLGANRYVAGGQQGLWIGPADLSSPPVRINKEEMAVRSVRALPWQVQSRFQQEEQEAWRKEQIAKADMVLSRPYRHDSLKEVLDIAYALEAHTFVRDAWKLRLKRARCIQDMTTELDALLGLERTAQTEERNLDFMMLLAEGFNSLGIKERTIEWLNKVCNIEPRFRGAGELLATLDSTIIRVSGSWLVHEDVDVKFLPQEIKNYDLLGKIFNKVVVLETLSGEKWPPMTSGERLTPFIDPERILLQLRESSKTNLFDNAEVIEAEFITLNHREIRQNIVRITPPEGRGPDFNCFELWIEFRPVGEWCKFYSYVIMNPSRMNHTIPNNQHLLAWLAAITPEKSPVWAWRSEVLNFVLFDRKGIYIPLGQKRLAEINTEQA